MANEQNLRSFGDLPAEEHKALSSQGGKASGVSKRKAKSMREAARVLLEAAYEDDAHKAALLEQMGLEPDQQGAILLAAAERAKAGDIEAARFVRDTSGQAPAQQHEIGGIDGQPIEFMDLSGMTTEQLQHLLAQYPEDEKTGENPA